MSKEGEEPVLRSVYQSTFSAKKIETAVDREVLEFDELMQRVRQRMKARGFQGIRSAGRTFRVFDDDGNRKLNTREFSKALTDMGIVVSRAEMTLLFKYFDKNQDGNIDFEEFLLALRPPMSDARHAMVVQAFRKLDTDNSGVITIQELQEKYDASRHPLVLTGEKTEEQVLIEFSGSFEGKYGNKDGKVEFREFEQYYQEISASIDDDEYFIEMMKRAWRLSEDDSVGVYWLVENVERLKGNAAGNQQRDDLCWLHIR